MGLSDIPTDMDIIENACAMEFVLDELLLEHCLPKGTKTSILSCSFLSLGFLCYENVRYLVLSICDNYSLMTAYLLDWLCLSSQVLSTTYNSCIVSLNKCPLHTQQFKVTLQNLN